MGRRITDPEVAHEHAQRAIATLVRTAGKPTPEDIEQLADDLAAAQRALARSRTDPAIAQAIADAPPLGQGTIAKLSALLPPASSTVDGGDHDAQVA